VTLCIAMACCDGYVIAADTCVSDCGSHYEYARKIHEYAGEAIAGAGKYGIFQHTAERWSAGGPGTSSLQAAVRECARDGMNMNLLYVGPGGIKCLDALGSIVTPRTPWMTAGSGMHMAFGWLGAKELPGTLHDGRPELTITCEEAANVARQCLAFVASYETDVAAPFDVLTLRRD
jgi:20S proteasome alpha/beta subunit